ncbi:DUF3108 domain-containing protein [bacterium]|nr:DUF3108 domain-containing protein [bacterium]
MLKSRLITFFIPSLLVFVLVCSALAEYIHPSTLEVNVPHHQVEIPSFEAATYVYKIKWQGITVANAEIITTRGEFKSNLESTVARVLNRVRIYVETNGAIDIFYKLRHYSENIFTNETYLPSCYFSWQKENSRERMRFIHFKPEGMVHTSVWKNEKLDLAMDFPKGKEMLDPVTGAMFARALKFDTGEVKDFDIWSGKHRFIISFEIGEKEMLKTKFGEIEAYKVIPNIRRLTDTEPEKRLTSAALWISADNSRRILRLETKVWVGRVVAELVEIRSPNNLLSGEDQQTIQEQLSEIIPKDQFPQELTTACR